MTKETAPDFAALETGDTAVLVAAWMTERVDFIVDDSRPKTADLPRVCELWDDFSQWMRGNGARACMVPAVNMFGQHLKRAPGVRTSRVARGSVVRGITLKSNEPDEI